MAHILAILAHPDDAEIWAGGTLLNHAQAGDSTLICTLSGDSQSLRGQEAASGAAVLGAQLRLLDQPDRHIEPSPKLVDALAYLVRDTRPSIIITHWEHDAHPDHAATCAAVRRAVIVAGNTSSIDLLLACDTYLGSGRTGLFQPELYIDVSATWERKLAAIRQHARQNPEHYVNLIERQCWLHGARAGVRYAEGFQRIPIYGRLGGAQRLLGQTAGMLQGDTIHR